VKITVCEFPDEAARRGGAWAELIRHLKADPADVVVLPEMPFCEWKVFTTRTVERNAWQAALAAHDEMIARMAELPVGMVLSSRPVDVQGRRLNQAFCWTRDGGYRAARAKYHLPDGPDGWEATWFDRGDRDFAPLTVGAVTVGFQICTELLFSEAAWEMGRRGAQLIAAPRATSGHRRWPMAASLAAIMSGCFVASANRRSHDGEAFPGHSWVVSPEGELLGETTAESPFVTVEVELAAADRAKQTYPRNLPVPDPTLEVVRGAR
jgi:N-carbamoylputrescine amidase